MKEIEGHREAGLHPPRGRLAGAVAGARRGVWRWEVGDPTITWDPMASESLGLPDILLRSPELLLEATHPQDLALVSGVGRVAWQSGERVVARLRITFEGQTRWFDVSGQSLQDGSGRPFAATGTAVEATEAAHSNERVEQTLQHRMAALERCLALAWRWDPNTGSIRVLQQPAGFTVAADLPAEVELATIVARIYDRDAGRFRDTLALAAFDRRPFTLEISVRDDGHLPRRLFLRGRATRTGDLFEVVGALLD